MKNPHDALWERRHALELCRSRGVHIAAFDFIVHNLSRQAAEAALRAMPVIA
jgi:hypothetical protein